MTFGRIREKVFMPEFLGWNKNFEISSLTGRKIVALKMLTKFTNLVFIRLACHGATPVYVGCCCLEETC